MKESVISMKYISFDIIKDLNITPKNCIDWAKQSLLYKYSSVLPPKISIKFNDGCFFNTMPSLLPNINRFGVKIVSRYPRTQFTKTNDIQKEIPSLSADILLYDTESGELLSIMDGTWITSMRTGAIAAISINLLKKKSANTYSFIGLGNTARATLLCLNEILKHQPISVKLLAYKDQHKIFIERFSSYNNIKFEVYDSAVDMIRVSEVIISCVTTTKDIFATDDTFSEGVLVVPVHTMGFQNCDLFFDKVFCDDIGHVNNFKYFDKFQKCDEIANVLSEKIAGRETEKERILAYNIGISLQDIFFASNIYNLLEGKGIVLSKFIPEKFWV